MNDKIAEFEQEKFEMQKQHTQNIQELLDETNQRLQKMETEYNQQNATTVSNLALTFIIIIKIQRTLFPFTKRSTTSIVTDAQEEQTAITVKQNAGSLTLDWQPVQQ